MNKEGKETTARREGNGNTVEVGGYYTRYTTTTTTTPYDPLLFGPRPVRTQLSLPSPSSPL